MHTWYLAMALGAILLGLVARRRPRPLRRVEGVPDWVYQAFAARVLPR